MIIGGIQKVSLIDYPGLVSTVLFTRGCNMRCIYCHNSNLVLPERYSPNIEEKEIFNFLNERKNRIDAVVISGGEPTLHKDLPEFILKVKQIGYKIKLDTNGTNPGLLKELINKNLLDFIAMDIKSTFEKYSSICGVEIDIKKIQESIQILRNSSIPKEFRTTILKGLHSRSDIQEIQNSIVGGAVKLQGFKVSGEVLDKSLDSGYEYSEEQILSLMGMV